jgi:hypothetical protein
MNEGVIYMTKNLKHLKKKEYGRFWAPGVQGHSGTPTGGAWHPVFLSWPKYNPDGFDFVVYAWHTLLAISRRTFAVTSARLK